MLDSVSHGYVSLEMAGGFGDTAVDSPESWAWILDSVDAPLLNRTTPRPAGNRAAGDRPPRRAPAHLNNPEIRSTGWDNEH